MKRRTLVQASALAIAAAACTGVSSNDRASPLRGDQPKAIVVPAERHDVSPPLREIPPPPRPPEDMRREVPIHRLPPTPRE